MKDFLKSKIGLCCVAGFVVLMAAVLQRVSHKRTQRTTPTAVKQAGAAAAIASPVKNRPDPRALTDETPFMEEYLRLGQTRAERDRQGTQITHRNSPATPADAGRTTEDPAVAPVMTRASLRLQGKPGMPHSTAAPAPNTSAPQGDALTGTRPNPTAEVVNTDRERFNPYGRVIKCELVFTIDSTNEQTPLVAVVMEPVYNNGHLVIPAGAEMHGSTRPDRLRNRIFSGTDWVLVFPREGGQINGRQLNVRGVALDRLEPDANGMTWGITDGSYGLQGIVIRTLQQEEIKRFVATFLGGTAMGLQERQSERGGQQSLRNTPRNAALQGFAANFDRMVEEITDEIERHGVFLRVPAGHQFYFYPMQIIDPERAAVSSDVATVK